MTPSPSEHWVLLLAAALAVAFAGGALWLLSWGVGPGFGPSGL